MMLSMLDDDELINYLSGSDDEVVALLLDRLEEAVAPINCEECDSARIDADEQEGRAEEAMAETENISDALNKVVEALKAIDEDNAIFDDEEVMAYI